MTEADILALTYEDSCTIYRACRKKLPNGETQFLSGQEGEVVQNNIPCALTRHSGGKFSQGPSTAKAPTDYLLFVRPEADVKAGDFILVIHFGKTAAYTAGQPDYHKSHTEVPITPERNFV